MKGHYSIDYEYDYILWFRTNSALSNETYLTIKSQMQKCITTKSYHPIYWTTAEIVFYNHISLWETVLYVQQILFEQFKKKKSIFLFMMDFHLKHTHMDK